MKNQEIAEIFANSSEEARTGNLFIEGRAIYSYGHHFKIAEKIGHSEAIFNLNGYSNTTAKHKNYVLRELKSNGFKIIYLLNCDIKELKETLLSNENDIKRTEATKPRNERTITRKIERLNELKEQNVFLIDLAIKNNIITEAI